MTLDPGRSATLASRTVEKLRYMVRHELGHAHIVSRRQAVVTAVSVGPPASVSIQIAGDTDTISGVRYLASYTPSVGDTVWVDVQDSDPIVIGRLA